ncbi:MAG: undecaprenyldiphospho-muramoylpentapeptide beta-N-acetylglucosaminyltransferase [Acetivibrionales bacterium]
MNILLAGGGTAGHINPAIAIAKNIRKKYPDANILFIGTKRGMETELVPREGFELKCIRVRGFKRKLSLEVFITLKELFQGIMEARKLIREFKPDIVIGTGGYVCGPVVLSASRLKVPTLIHEQNALPGITNKLLSRVADITAISFRDSKRYFKGAKRLEYTGNPIRCEMFSIDRNSARRKLEIGNDEKLVVIFGGSLGAKRINEAVVDMIKKYYKRTDCRIIFGTGRHQFNDVMEMIASFKPDTVEVLPYIYDMATVMRAADIIVCRAGAITVSELTALGTPSILIPSPNVTANHQEYNARALEKEGASIVLLEKDLNGLSLYNRIISILTDREKLKLMSENSKKIGITNAADNIYSLVKELINKS